MLPLIVSWASLLIVPVVPVVGRRCALALIISMASSYVERLVRFIMIRAGTLRVVSRMLALSVLAKLLVTTSR